MNHDERIIQLYDVGAIQFGSFTLENGIVSPIYLDLKKIISYPALLKDISRSMWRLVQLSKYDLVCGVPYSAIPIATSISLENNIPLIVQRKEIKINATQQQIEGVFKKGQNCLIVEDLITNGSNILSTIASIENVGLKCKDIIVLIDREQGGCNVLLEKGYRVHSVLTITNIFETLFRFEVISMPELEIVKSFIAEYH